MEKWESYFHQPKPIEELIKSALIVVDANVLLSAYQWRDLTVKEMMKTLGELSDEGRLRIPLQVIKEFSGNRPKEIVQRVNDVETILSSLQSQKPLNQIVPILEGRENFNETLKSQTSYNETQKIYKKGLIKLRDDLKELFNNDPYLKGLEEIIRKSFYHPTESKSEEELVKEAEKRFKSKIPPGYKDDSKDNNSAGDYIIWHNILSLNTDVIFVSGDKKPDWVYSDKQKNPISARRELIEEFHLLTEGKDFAHLSPKDFITLLNPLVSEEIKEDLSINYSKIEKNRTKNQNILDNIHDIICNYDPMDMINNNSSDLITEHYRSVAQEILIKINELVTHTELRNYISELLEERYADEEQFFEMISTLHKYLANLRKKHTFDGAYLTNFTVA